MDNIFQEIEIMPDNERELLFNKIKHTYYTDNQRFYTVSGETLTQSEYTKRVHEGAEQCRHGQSVSLEHLTASLGYDYASL